MAVAILSAAAISLLAARYYYVRNIDAAPADKIKYLSFAADIFLNVGLLICIVSWIALNIIAVKTARLFWLLIPCAFTVAIAVGMSYQAEDLFHFKKANGLWKGGFSLSYLFSFFIILLGVIITGINYFVLLRVTKTKVLLNE